MRLTKAQTLGRNMGLRAVMLQTYAPGWSSKMAQELAGLSATGWSNYRRARHPFPGRAVLDRIAHGLGMSVPGLLEPASCVMQAEIPADWLALPEREEPPQTRQDAP